MVMKPNEFTYDAADGTRIFAYKWANDNPKAVVQIAHGAIEHAMRYDDFANALVNQGFTVYASDHRGHGKTADGAENVAYFSDKDGGFSMAVDDMYALTTQIKQENEGLPVFLLGHSMGSLMSRVYASRYGKELDGLVLTGTGRTSSVLISIVQALAKRDMKKNGRKHKSPFLHSLVFGTLNRPFKGKTGSEFICTDEKVVDAYAADELCGNTATGEFVYELLWGTRQASAKETFEKYPIDLPLFIGSGEFDTVGGSKLKAVKKDVADFEKAGVKDLTFKKYDGMRHEILNEKDKQTVYQDIIGWLEKRVS